MNVLMVDIGGSNIKLMNARDAEMRKVRSGNDLGPHEVVECIVDQTRDWTYDAVSIGYPGLIRNGRPVRDPLNVGEGWVHFDFTRAFEKPVRLINDAAMQALGNYIGGRLLFLGFGTSIGTCLIADDQVIPIEIGLIRFSRNQRFMDRLSKKALKEQGLERWREAVHEAIDLLHDIFRPDDTVLGGGNSKHIEPLPSGCRIVGNNSAYVGAERLWEGADLQAVPLESTWRVQRRDPIIGEAHASFQKRFVSEPLTYE